MKKQIAVIGNGWLGNKMLDSLIAEGYNSQVFSRNTNQLPHVIDFTLGEKIPSNLLNRKIVFFCLPPSFRKLDVKNQLLAHFNFFDQLESDSYVIYTSSTSVYTTDGMVNESSPCDGPIFEIENKIRNRFDKHLIFRLGGLAGPNRTIVNMLQKKQRIDSYDAPTNLLHLLDAVKGITLGINSEKEGTFNLCSDAHPSKFEVYNSWNKKLELPELPKGTHAINKKIVDNQLWKDSTNYRFQFTSPLDFEF